MKVTLFPCGPAANESELKAFEHLKIRLSSMPGNDEWVLMANLAFSVTHQLQADEIDIVVIGPPGVRVIEIKHWTTQWVNSNPDLVNHEADKVIDKARKIATTLRKHAPDLPYVEGVILLTREPSTIKSLDRRNIRGVRFYTLNGWKKALNIDAPLALSRSQVEKLARVLEPKSSVALDGSLRRMAGYVNLELQTPKEERFHRVYKGIHSSRQDRVILHLYDLSASNEKNAEAKAKREFNALHHLQLYPWAPRILDSYQKAPGYAGEMFFFTLVDPAAPCIADRASDNTWDTMNRLKFARETIRAVTEFHNEGSKDGPFVHRNLTPRTILVKHNNSPILTGFSKTKIPSSMTVASTGVPQESEKIALSLAPEVRMHGVGAADQRSDVYSLCASLKILFQKNQDDTSARSLELLECGLAGNPEDRCTLEDIEKSFSLLLGESVAPSSALPARFWTEDQVVRFNGRDYRILSLLGSGGVGATFKIVEIDRVTKEDLGTYVAKVVHEAQMGQQVLRSYSLARSHLGRHAGLSAIYEVAQEWRENDFVALMTWVEGTPLGEFAGVFPLLAEDQSETSSEALAVRWLRTMCEALDVLHRNNLVHGDVSPRNMIVSGNDLVLTDYDFVGKIGEPITGLGTILYCSPSQTTDNPAIAANDFYALAASFFHVVFDREPFRYGGEIAKERGVNWGDIDRASYPILAAFIDRATHPDATQRWNSADEALTILAEAAGVSNLTRGMTDKTSAIPAPPHISTAENDLGESGQPLETSIGTPLAESQALREQRIEWLHSLLQSYPGSRWGNRETRGLDTPFAAQTYVETMLEETLVRDIRTRRVRLVILCGNAGDGKTALLQHIANRLEFGDNPSSERIIEGQMQDGMVVRMNLDGSASWRGRSADDILDEFLAPFQDGAPDEDIVHLLAINDGRLLEWIQGVEYRNGGVPTELTEELHGFLQNEAIARESHIRFINLNQRSLVGGVTPDRTAIETEFLDQLLDHLYGGEEAKTIWSPCQSCSAKERCEVFRAARVFGPHELPDSADQETRHRARQRLFEALQAVHLRGETHITIRELRATLVYVLFGIHFCEDYHSDADVRAMPYWDRAFASDSPSRQGETLRELTRFDPAFEAHPQIDRYLLTKPATDDSRTTPHYENLSLESARRRAYFEWTEEHIEQITENSYSLGLARGRNLQLFRNLALIQRVEEQQKLREHLCNGISRLEDLPFQALDRPGVVPLRIMPRTPTETAFWVEKPLDNFYVESDLPPEVEGVERLHRQASLVYRYHDGQEERLRLGAELFHLLLELGEGYQLGDVSTDDVFANLSIFVQRLVREDERELLAWTPVQDEAIYKVSARIDVTPDGYQQKIVLNKIMQGV
jgi:serine/threonine protein kinase